MTRIAFVLTLLILSGCENHTYRYFEFESASRQTKYGEAGAVLSGEFIKVSEEPQITHFGSPYRFMITFHTDAVHHSPVAVSGIRVLSAAGEPLYEFDAGELETRWSNYFEDWFSVWTFDYLDLEHSPLTIEYELIFSDEQSEIINIPFTPKYREEKSNDFWDGIMSV